MSETQATPAVLSEEGPTSCINCGEMIRRFGQTCRWCHDQTGNVQCSAAGATQGDETSQQAGRMEVHWGNVTPDGDWIPRPTERDARRTAESRGWPTVRRTVVFSPWEQVP